MDNLPLRHILISVDESEASKRAFDWAVENLYRDGDTVHLFNVIAPADQYVALSPMDVGMGAVIENEAETAHRMDQATEFLKNTFSSTLESKNIPFHMEVIKSATDNDSIGSAICKRADQINAAAVVIAKHNKGNITEFFVGSVTNYCIKHCKSPVVVMHVD